jgi:hypothetical protein
MFLDTVHECNLGRFGNYQCSKSNILASLMRKLYKADFTVEPSNPADMIKEMRVEGLIDFPRVASMEITTFILTDKGRERLKELNQQDFRAKTISLLSEDRPI